MKIYSTYYMTLEGNEERETFTTVSAAKKWMKERPGSTGTITKIWSNGDWEPCGEITLQESNAIQMSNQNTPTY